MVDRRGLPIGQQAAERWNGPKTGNLEATGFWREMDCRGLDRRRCIRRALVVVVVVLVLMVSPMVVEPAETAAVEQERATCLRLPERPRRRTSETVPWRGLCLPAKDEFDTLSCFAAREIQSFVAKERVFSAAQSVGQRIVRGSPGSLTSAKQAVTNQKEEEERTRVVSNRGRREAAEFGFSRPDDDKGQRWQR